MKACIYCLIAILLGTAIAWGQEQGGPRDPTAADDGIEVLTRGPVHEAFAETILFDPEPGFVAPRAPPTAIEEVPPEQRPQGANVAWIPGYWAWDDERGDFLWVSGIWRALPPGRQWVPGYWGRSRQGAQWTSGYWADAQASEVEYLPEPPATVEVGPNVAAPSADHHWLPGCWVWQQNRYAWRPGFWAEGQSDWDWVPAHYVWTARGYVFVDGYYDYSVIRRGVLFAPIYFKSGIYTQRGYSYTPAVAISPSVFARHLFLRPSYSHYYFGDYYGSKYSSIGFSPWFSFHTSRHGYDPFFAQQRWMHRQDQEWERNIRTHFQNHRDHENLRPPRTWADQRARVASSAPPNRQSLVIAAPLAELATNKEHPLRFQSLDKTEREQFARHEQAVRQFREQRQNLEVQAADRSAANSQSPGEVQRAKVRLPRSPFVAQPVERFGTGEVPPRAMEAPQPDTKIEPRLRIRRGNSAAPTELKATRREPRPEQLKPSVQSKRELTESPPKDGSDDRGPQSKGPSKGESKGPSKGNEKSKPGNS